MQSRNWLLITRKDDLVALCIDSYFRRLSLPLADRTLLARRGRSPDQAGHDAPGGYSCTPSTFPAEGVSQRSNVRGNRQVATRFAILSAVLLESRKPTLSTSEPIRDATQGGPSA